MATPETTSTLSARPPSLRTAYVAWAAVCLIWGTTYLGIRIALETIPPALLGGLRFTIAGLVVAMWVIARGDRLPPLAAWPLQAVIGTLLLAVGNGLVVWAQQYVPSGIAAVGIASTPFWMAGLDAASGGDRLNARLIAGFCIGFGGIIVLIWPDLLLEGGGPEGFVAGIVAVQLACLGWAAGSAVSKRVTPPGSTIAASAVQQFAGGLVMLVVGTARGEWAMLAFSERSLTAALYLLVFGSLVAYSAYVYALQHLPISTVSLYAYINPVIAVLLGTLLLDEPFGLRIVVAAGMVLTGVAVVRSSTVRHGPGES